MKSTTILLVVLSVAIGWTGYLRSERIEAAATAAATPSFVLEPAGTKRSRWDWDASLPPAQEPLSGADDPCYRVRQRAAYGLYGYPRDRLNEWVPEEPVREDSADAPIAYRELREAVCSPEATARHGFLRQTFEWRGYAPPAPAHHWDRHCSVIAMASASREPTNGYEVLRDMACASAAPSRGLKPLSKSFACDGRLRSAEGVLIAAVPDRHAHGVDDAYLGDLVRLMLFMEQGKGETASHHDCGEFDGMNGGWRPRTVGWAAL
jgi:hypothetical protein